MRVKWLVVIAALTVCAGCTKSARTLGLPMRTTPQFEVELTRYAKLPAQKSMAIAGDPKEIYVSGYAYDYLLQEAAVQAALKYCELRREDLRIEAECRTYAIGDEIIGEDQLATPSP